MAFQGIIHTINKIMDKQVKDDVLILEKWKAIKSQAWDICYY